MSGGAILLKSLDETQANFSAEGVKRLSLRKPRNATVTFPSWLKAASCTPIPWARLAVSAVPRAIHGSPVANHQVWCGVGRGNGVGGGLGVGVGRGVAVGVGVGVAPWTYFTVAESAPLSDPRLPPVR
jgi:hypothetical protein